MENTSSLNESACSFCKKPIEEDVIFCPHCGHPENGTEKERAQFFAKRAMNKNKAIDAKDKISSARNTLFVLAGIMVLFGIIIYGSTNSVLDLGINLFFAFIYLVLAFWSEQKPFIALLIGLFLYITLIVINAIIDPVTLVRGIIWKVLIISYLGKGIYSALEARNKENSSN
jgi:type III secretory pathway component EscR